MAAGQTHIMAKFVANMAGSSLADVWATDTIKCAFVTNVAPPSLIDSDPRWGAGGAQNYSTNEVAAGGNYSAGGVSLAGETVTLVGAVVSLNATSPISVAANAANPTGAFWAIFYDSSDAGKRVIGYMDLGGSTTLVPGLQININGAATGTQPIFQGTAT